MVARYKKITTPARLVFPEQRRSALVVFTRSPGCEVKPFGLGRANVALARTMVSATLSTVRRAAHLVDIVVASDEADVTCGGVGAIGHDILAIRQCGFDFESRLLGTLRDVARMGYQRVVVVGTDTPTMTATDLRKAIDAPPGSMTIGPSHDGGFYLVGMDACHLDLLVGLPWRRGTLLRHLLSRCSAAGVAQVMLPLRRDIDDARDVRMLLPILDGLCRRLHGAGLDGRQSGVRFAIRHSTLPPCDGSRRNAPPRSPPPGTLIPV